MPIRLLLSSKHKVVCEGIAAVLLTHPDIHLVGMADTHESTQALCQAASPDVVLIGMQSHDARNLALMQQIASQQSACNMVAFSVDSDRNSVMEVLDLSLIHISEPTRRS